MVEGRVKQLLFVAVLVLLAQQRLALGSAERRLVRGLLLGVLVRVQSQQRRLRQQHPHEAEQQENGE